MEEWGLRTEFGIIARKPQEIPCAWKEVQEIEAKWTMTLNGEEAALIGEKDQVYVTLGDHAPAEARCPTNYVWMETADPDTRVVHRLRNSPEREFPKLQEGKRKENWNKQFKEDYTFFQLGRMVELKRQVRTIDWPKVDEGHRPETAARTARARLVTLTGKDQWFTLKCWRKEVLLATDWNIASCYRDVPVWVELEGERSSIRFLTMGSRLLVNHSKTESCRAHSKKPW